MIATVPADPGGESTVTSVPLALMLSTVADADPKVTEVAPVRPVPATFTFVPPAVVPLDGVTEVITGPVKVYRSALAGVLVAPCAVIRMSTVPAGSAGTVAVTLVPFLLTLNEVAGTVPNTTEVAPAKPVPLIFTFLPPDPGPVDGFTSVMTGAG